MFSLIPISKCVNSSRFLCSVSLSCCSKFPQIRSAFDCLHQTQIHWHHACIHLNHSHTHRTCMQAKQQRIGCTGWMANPPLNKWDRFSNSPFEPGSEVCILSQLSSIQNEHTLLCVSSDRVSRGSITVGFTYLFCSMLLTKVHSFKVQVGAVPLNRPNNALSHQIWIVRICARLSNPTERLWNMFITLWNPIPFSNIWSQRFALI